MAPWQDQRKGENAGEHQTGKALCRRVSVGVRRC